MNAPHHLRLIIAVLLFCLVYGCHPASAITRDDVINRAQSWVDAKVPYNQSGYYPDPNPSIGFREDCSGYVYFCWNTKGPDPLYFTGTLSDITDPISPNDLKAGDILLNNVEGHVVLFASWADTSHTYYWVYEEVAPGWVTQYHKILYPYWVSDNSGEQFHPEHYLPRRYRSIQDGGGISDPTNIYVSLSGNDTGNGSSGAPFRTIKHAIDAASATQAATIHIAPGSYGEKIGTGKHIQFVVNGSGTVQTGR